MTDSFSSGHDPNAPPNMADATDVAILAFDDPGDWDAGQAAFVAWAREHAVSGLVPPSAPIEGMGRLIGSMHKLAVVADGADFVYRIYGERIKHAANLDLQPETVAGLVEPARAAFLAHYRDLMRRPRLFVGAARYDGLIRGNPCWRRAVAPAGDGVVEGFFVLTYPADDPP